MSGRLTISVTHDPARGYIGTSPDLREPKKPRLRYCPMTSSSRFPLIAVPGWSETGGDVF